MSELQWNGLSRREAASAAKPQNLSHQMHGLRWKGKDYGRQLRRRYFFLSISNVNLASITSPVSSRTSTAIRCPEGLLRSSERHL